MELFTLGDGVANLEHATRIGQPNDITWPCLVNGRLALGHKLRRTGEAQRLTLTYMQVGLVALELSGAHLAEGDTGAVIGVDISGNLEDKTRKLLLVGLHHALFSLGGLGRRGYLNETVQQLLHAKVVQRRTKEYGSHLC